MAKIALHGNPIDTNGELPKVGTKAPDFRLVDTRLNDVSLADFKGKKKILAIVPGIETDVCRKQARTFHERAGTLADTVVLVVSADLPLAQKRVCEAEGLDHVVPLSMMRSRNFGKDYGVLITNGPLEGVVARAVVVLDENDTVLHAQLVPEIDEEPDYDAALASLR